MTQGTFPKTVESTEFDFIKMKGLEEENEKLKQLLKNVVMYGESYKDWCRTYGSTMMTNQKQALNNLNNSVSEASKFLNK